MDDEKLDWASLERELQAAVAADAKYQRENEAKLRAITQRVGSYEEFRDIVLASHLRPLETCDKVRLGGDVHAQRWNAFATTKEEGSDESQHETPQVCPRRRSCRVRRSSSTATGAAARPRTAMRCCCTLARGVAVTSSAPRLALGCWARRPSRWPSASVTRTPPSWPSCSEPSPRPRGSNSTCASLAARSWRPSGASAGAWGRRASAGPRSDPCPARKRRPGAARETTTVLADGRRRAEALRKSWRQ
ncbi:coiled-coil domain-containing protein 103 isoform X2 [Lethenteron reissneri]|uniref:coiled-coil domain-containing protein 103 isoform X2 n=1 Tax=Lethenteron reissneri TaxID=7753 RepID=UPI002AB7BECE|nr:coiled-coil domain-containing protein 103 isoform X2 [Lethenteron reissneri]